MRSVRRSLSFKSTAAVSFALLSTSAILSIVRSCSVAPERADASHCLLGGWDSGMARGDASCFSSSVIFSACRSCWPISRSRAVSKKSRSSRALPCSSVRFWTVVSRSLTRCSEAFGAASFLVSVALSGSPLARGDASCSSSSAIFSASRSCWPISRSRADSKKSRSSLALVCSRVSLSIVASSSFTRCSEASVSPCFCLLTGSDSPPARGTVGLPVFSTSRSWWPISRSRADSKQSRSSLALRCSSVRLSTVASSSRIRWSEASALASRSPIVWFRTSSRLVDSLTTLVIHPPIFLFSFLTALSSDCFLR
mmetsp:Transcript_29833/g.70251  ORF Transcript_29833/g.70251 Transcript_29833/m.70251 type:complete len:311 (-) Transcript_29833:355-1287(-)